MGLTSDTIILEIGDDPFNISRRRAYYANNDFLMKMDNRRIIVGNVDFTVLRANQSKTSLEIERTAKAGSFEMAALKADSIKYSFHADSNKLKLNPYFSFPQMDLLRAQEVDVILRIPMGKVIYLSEEMLRIIDDIPNVSRTYDPRMVGHYWRMEAEGLTCIDCEEEKSDDEEQVQHVETEISVEI